MQKQEFLALVTPFKDKVFRLAKRLLVSTEAAEDATQEVMVKLWTKNVTFSELKSVEAMAMAITKNYCLDQLKAKRSSNLQLLHSNFQDQTAGLHQQLEDRDSLQWVTTLLQELPEQQRIILQLREVEAYDFATIATVLGMNETAVRVALSRARKTLRERMIKIHNYGLE